MMVTEQSVPFIDTELGGFCMGWLCILLVAGVSGPISHHLIFEWRLDNASSLHNEPRASVTISEARFRWTGILLIDFMPPDPPQTDPVHRTQSHNSLSQPLVARPSPVGSEPTTNVPYAGR